MKTLIRRRELRRLTWVCTVCLCPKNGTLGLYGLILYERFARINEKTVKIISGSSILIRQNNALIDNFDVKFLEMCIVF